MNQASEILDRLPPQNLDAEKGVLGSLILDPRKCDDVAEIVAADDFYANANQKLYMHMMAMRDQGGQIDIVLLVERLRQAGDLEAIGGTAYLHEVVGSVAVAAHAVYYASIVAQLAKLRRLIQIATGMLRDAYDRDHDPADVLESAETGFAGVRMVAGEGEPVTLADASLAAMLRIDQIQERGQSAGLPTGLFSFDHDQGGLFPGELTILAARPGVGKTSLALQIASHNAGRGRLVYFASLEMSAPELATRLACGESGVSNRQVRTGRLRMEDRSALCDAMNQQARTALHIHDRSALTVAEIRRQIRKRTKDGLALAVVDYLQLITASDCRLPREQQVARIVRTLKETAREYSIPILCLCQLNRQADADEIPRLSQLRESGSIEQDADVVLFLSQHEPTDDAPHNAVLTVAKNRNGETGHLRLDWDGPRTRFDCPAAPQPYEDFSAYSSW